MTDRITHAARSRWERGQTRISGRYVHMRWDELKPDVRDALVEEMRLTAADLEPAVEAVGERTMTMGEAGKPMFAWGGMDTAPRSDETRVWLTDGRWAAMATWGADKDVWRDMSGNEFNEPVGWAYLEYTPPPPNTGKGEGV